MIDMDNLRFQDLSGIFCNQVFDIERASISEPWTLNQICELISDSSAVVRIGVIDGEVICYYSFYDICGEGNINNLAVKEDHRGKGVGSLLIEDMLNVAKEKNLMALTLEVNEKNCAAISLYNKFGFKTEGKRIKFYGGKDDALIMWK
ncbi:MAG: ribosomal protein S18-alanine N-acetyltransferase, partial [Clostridia bacterium]|nr:ribosomal protein S18-alanine N-acetyltransferase [Clostridia bacterium]